MLRTGAGLTVVLIAAMGFCVSALVVSQTLYTITQGHLDHYATLLALGFSRLQLTTVVVIQALFIGVSGILGGTSLVMAVVDASVNTPVPVQVHVPVHLILCALHLTVCLLAGFLPVRSIFRMDPVLVFRA
jgi:putative ABC transport system permease protein